jgi:hypothetical protein
MPTPVPTPPPTETPQPDGKAGDENKSPADMLERLASIETGEELQQWKEDLSRMKFSDQNMYGVNYMLAMKEKELEGKEQELRLGMQKDVDNQGGELLDIEEIIEKIENQDFPQMCRNLDKEYNVFVGTGINIPEDLDDYKHQYIDVPNPNKHPYEYLAPQPNWGADPANNMAAVYEIARIIYMITRKPGPDPGSNTNVKVNYSNYGPGSGYYIQGIEITNFSNKAFNVSGGVYPAVVSTDEKYGEFSSPQLIFIQSTMYIPVGIEVEGPTRISLLFTWDPQGFNSYKDLYIP